MKDSSSIWELIHFEASVVYDKMKDFPGLSITARGAIAKACIKDMTQNTNERKRVITKIAQSLDLYNNKKLVKTLTEK